jgi:hypothetical protein
MDAWITLLALLTALPGAVISTLQVIEWIEKYKCKGKKSDE